MKQWNYTNEGKIPSQENIGNVEKNLKGLGFHFSDDFIDHILQPIEPYKTIYTIKVYDIKLSFRITDIYGNPIEVELALDILGLLYDITIGSEEPETKNVKFEKCEDGYYIREYQTKTRDYKLTLRNIYSTDKIEFKYYKRPGTS